MSGGQAMTFEVMEHKADSEIPPPALWFITPGLGRSVLLVTLLSE